MDLTEDPVSVSKLYDSIIDNLKTEIQSPYDNSIVEIYTTDFKLFTVKRDLMVVDEDNLSDIFPFSMDFLKSIKPCYIQYSCNFKNSYANMIESYEIFRRNHGFIKSRKYKVLQGDISLIPNYDGPCNYIVWVPEGTKVDVKYF